MGHIAASLLAVPLAVPTTLSGLSGATGSVWLFAVIFAAHGASGKGQRRRRHLIHFGYERVCATRGRKQRQRRRRRRPATMRTRAIDHHQSVLCAVDVNDLGHIPGALTLTHACGESGFFHSSLARRARALALKY